MATAFVEYDQVLSYNPFENPLPESSFVVQYVFVLVGTDVPNGKLYSQIWVQVDEADTLNVLQSKIKTAAREAATNMSVTITTNGLVVPAYQKG